MSELITVKSTKEDGKVCLWERNDRHPDGEVFVSGDGVSHRVALTSEVALRLKDGVLVKVGETPVEVAPEPTEAEKQAEQERLEAEAKAKAEAEEHARVEAARISDEALKVTKSRKGE